MNEREFDTSTWVEHLSWPAIEQRVAAGAVALLPIGAASKEHGPHLPSGTDHVQARYFATALAARINALIWPVVSYGYYPAFIYYPGSVSLRAQTFTALVADIRDSIERAGVGHLVIINTGLSTIRPLQDLIDSQARKMRCTLLNCYAGERFTSAVDALQTQAFGGHADEIETALMLAIDEPSVALERAVASAAPIIHGRFNRHDEGARNYSPSGVNGDPTRATVLMGQRLLQALLEDLFAGVSGTH